MESDSYWQKLRERQNIPRKAIQRRHISRGRYVSRQPYKTLPFGHFLTFFYSHTALLTLKEGFEGQMTEKTIEIGVIGVGAQISSEGQGQPQQAADGKKTAGLTFRRLVEAEVRDYLSL